MVMVVVMVTAVVTVTTVDMATAVVTVTAVDMATVVVMVMVMAVAMVTAVITVWDTAMGMGMATVSVRLSAASVTMLCHTNIRWGCHGWQPHPATADILFCAALIGERPDWDSTRNCGAACAPLGTIGSVPSWRILCRFREGLPLCNVRELWEHQQVKANWALHLVLAWLVAAGLVVAPFVAPSAAQPMSDPAISAMMEDMPCCPDQSGKQAPKRDHCKDCALMVLCALKTLQAFVSPSVQPIYLGDLLTELTPGSDPRVEDIGSSPPARPPRSLIAA